MDHGALSYYGEGEFPEKNQENNLSQIGISLLK